MSDPIVDHDAPTVCEVRSSKWPHIAAALLLIAYGGLLAQRFHPAIATPDANGYWAQGRLLADTGQTWFKPESPLRFIGMHWLVMDEERYASRYPPGLPVLIAAVCKVFGADASMLLNPLFALASLAGVYFILVRLLSPTAGLTGMLALICMPRFAHHAEACDSHMAVTVLLVWGIYLLLRWRDSGRLWQLYLAGALLGAIPTVRYPEGLFALGIGLFLLAHCRRHGKPALQIGVATAGAFTPVLPLLIRNHLLFGGFWRTGYTLTNEQTGFGWEYFQAYAVQYLKHLSGSGAGLFWALGIVGIALLCCQRGQRPLGGLLALIVLPTTLLYMSYYWAPDNASATLRFLLPTFAIYAIAGVWMLWRLLEFQSPATRGIVVGSILLVHAGWGIVPLLQESRELAHKRQALSMITNAVRSHANEGDVILSHGIILQQLDSAGNWRLADADLAAGGAPGGRPPHPGGDPDAPSPMQAEKNTAAAQHYEGLSGAERDMMIAFDLDSYADKGKVFYVGPENQLRAFAGRDLHWQDFEILATLTLPKAPPSASSNRRGGMGGGPPGGMRAPGGGPPGGMRDRMRRGGRGGPGGGGLGGLGGFNSIAQLESIVVAEWR